MSLGYSGVEIHGAKPTAYSQNDLFTTEDFETWSWLNRKRKKSVPSLSDSYSEIPFKIFIFLIIILSDS